jgi:hypothetical protein
VLRIRSRDPGSGAFLTLGWEKNQDPDPEQRIHISDSLETIFWVKILKFFDADPGWKEFGSGINIPDPQYCYQ